MLDKYFPTETAGSVFEIEYDRLYDKGYRGLIFDIDNTLVHHGDDSNDRVDELFARLNTIGFKCLLLSNNNEARVLRFKENIDCMYICDADKPETGGYEEALKMLGLDKNSVICIGDQLFTDILGANRCKMASILVDFIRLPGVKKIGKKRRLEQVILFFYKRRRKKNAL